jgi:hypothetical protein
MGKKQYIAPKIMDLSIETITGIGARNCDHGYSFANINPICNHGYGATSTCKQGYAASAACTSGNLPYHSGVYCNNGGTAVPYCGYGLSASGAFGNCSKGDTVSGVCQTGASPVSSSCSGVGQTDAYCSNGNSQAPHVSS